LKNGHTKSCGCLTRKKSEEKMLNKRFGKLTVVKDSGERDYKQNIL
jgi:hypothetical protein